MGRIVTFSNPKGGVGKTTACVNMAAGLALLGKKVLVADIDPQGNATTGLGIEKNGAEGSLYDVLISGVPAGQTIKSTAVQGLDILPSSLDLAGGEVELAYIKGREARLKNALLEIKDGYDLIAIDCPPSLGLLTLNALIAADGLIIPMVCEYYALEGASHLLSAAGMINGKRGGRLHLDGVVITMAHGRQLISKQIREEIREHFKDSVFDAEIPVNVRISEAPSYGVPVLVHDGKSKGAAAYQALAKEYMQRYPL